MSDARPSLFSNTSVSSTGYLRAERAHRGVATLLFAFAGLSAGTLLLACTDPRVSTDSPPSVQEQARVDPSQPRATTDTVRLTGERITQGNAVDCPQIRDDSGKLHAVSYLSPAIEIGDRVTVSGVYGVSTRCVGTVLIVQTEAPPDN